MFRTRFMAVGMFAVVATSWYGLNRAELEGEWEIVSVQRDGVMDSTQVGSRVTFTGSTVTFQPRPVAHYVTLIDVTTLPRALLDGTR